MFGYYYCYKNAYFATFPIWAGFLRAGGCQFVSSCSFKKLGLRRKHTHFYSPEEHSYFSGILCLMEQSPDISNVKNFAKYVKYSSQQKLYCAIQSTCVLFFLSLRYFFFLFLNFIFCSFYLSLEQNNNNKTIYINHSLLPLNPPPPSPASYYRKREKRAGGLRASLLCFPCAV